MAKKDEKEILSNDNFEVKITKDDVVEVAIVEFETKLIDEIEKCKATETELGNKLNQLYIEYSAKTKVLLETVIDTGKILMAYNQLQTLLGAPKAESAEIVIGINCYSQFNVNYISEEEVKWRYQYSTPEELIPKLKQIDIAWSAHCKELKKELARVQDFKSKLYAEKSNLPVKQKQLRAAMTKFALNKTDSGKAIIAALEGVNLVVPALEAPKCQEEGTS